MRIYLILAVLIAVVWYINSKVKKILRSAEPSGGALEMEKDPVCGKFVSRDSAIIKRAAGKTRYYCSQSCASADD